MVISCAVEVACSSDHFSSKVTLEIFLPIHVYIFMSSTNPFLQNA